MLYGIVDVNVKSGDTYVWPVRGDTNGPAPVPKTGQTKCYDYIDETWVEVDCEGTGQDGEYQKGVAWPVPRFTDNEDGTVTDNLTGLMWAEDANLTVDARTWQGALDYVDGMNAGAGTYGYTDWRLPNRNELQSLIDCGKYNPALPSEHPFNNVQPINYLSSSTYESNPGSAWSVNMLYGIVDVNVKSGDTYVWPVRGDTNGPAPVPKTGQTTLYATGDDGDLEKGVAWPSPRFTDNGDGTVTDNLTGLIWLENANCFGARTWLQALSDCNGLAAGSCGLSDGSSAGDWRLPNRYELESLLDISNWNPALPTGHPFTGVQSTYYWSSTTYGADTFYAWLVYLSTGIVYHGNKLYFTYNVWPVRGGND